MYYGDEVARPLLIPDTQGDATLRSVMNWSGLKTSTYQQAVLEHWQKLGKFRKKHPAIGAGVHQQIAAMPYVFSRKFIATTFSDAVVVGLDLPIGKKTIPTGTVFPEGTVLHDSYSGAMGVVKNGEVTLSSDYMIVLLATKGK